MTLPARLTNGEISRTPTGNRFTFALILAALFLVLTWPVILSGSHGQDDTGAAGDQIMYHYPIIQKMARDWPHVNLTDLGGIQMTPTFHVIMAALIHFCHFDLTGLRLVSSLAGLLLIISVYWFTNKWVEPRAAFLLSLSYLFSPFMLSGAMWLMTDNLAWFFVSLALGWTVMCAATPGRVMASGMAAAAGAAFRQIHLWLIAPIAVSSLFELVPDPFRAASSSSAIPAAPQRRAQLLASALVALAGPVLVVLFFVCLWHGLLPPGTAKQVGTNNHFKIIPLALAQAGFCSVFLLPAVLHGPALKARIRDWRVWGAAAICLFLAAIPRSAEKQSPSGALVYLSGGTPVVFERLLILFPPAAFAGAALVIFFLAAKERGRGREAFLLIFGLVCWLSAQTVPVYPLRRYCDFVQVIIIWLAALGLSDGQRRLGFWIGTIAFVLVQFGMAVIRIYVPVIRG